MTGRNRDAEIGPAEADAAARLGGGKTQIHLLAAVQPDAAAGDRRSQPTSRHRDILPGCDMAMKLCGGIHHLIEALSVSAGWPTAILIALQTSPVGRYGEINEYF
ncbi:hypothetical protein Apmu_0142_05 [Acidiphilium multivorum AIU301]|nr:hypothetical protein Apmu_0142_05 [Acidiphilium multivorum AIU301]